MNKPALFICCGEMFSGKSTLAKKIAERYEARIVGRDEIYFRLEDLLAIKKTPEEEDGVLWDSLWPAVLQGVKNHLRLGRCVVVDDNCLYFREREDLRRIARELGAAATLIYLDTPAQVIHERKEKNRITRERHDVPSALILEDAREFERPAEEEHPLIFKPGDSVENLL